MPSLGVLAPWGELERTPRKRDDMRVHRLCMNGLYHQKFELLTTFLCKHSSLQFLGPFWGTFVFLIMLPRKTTNYEIRPTISLQFYGSTQMVM